MHLSCHLYKVLDHHWELVYTNHINITIYTYTLCIFCCNDYQVSICLVQFLGFECLFQFWKAVLSSLVFPTCNAAKHRNLFQNFKLFLMSSYQECSCFFCHHFQVVRTGFPESLARLPLTPVGCPGRARRSRSVPSLWAISSSYLQVTKPVSALCCYTNSTGPCTFYFYILFCLLSRTGAWYKLLCTQLHAGRAWHAAMSLWIYNFTIQIILRYLQPLFERNKSSGSFS